MADLWCSLVEALRVDLVKFLSEIFSASFLCSVILVPSCLPVSPIYTFSHWLHGILYTTPALTFIFFKEMDQVFSGVPDTFPCADDVKVQGSTEERHDIHLLETFERAYKAGLKFNPNKCCIKKQEIEYFGRIITPQGVKLCPKKVKNITMLAAPKDTQELQSLLVQ